MWLGEECELGKVGSPFSLRASNTRYEVTQPQRVSRLGFTPNPVFVSPEYAENIGDGRSPEFRESEQKRILGLLENF